MRVVRRDQLHAKHDRFGGAARAALLLAAIAAVASCRHDDESPRNVAPSTQPDLARTRPATAVEIDVLANDHAADGGALTIEIVSPPINASAVVTPHSSLWVLPAADFVGRVELEYVARGDRGAASAPTRLTIDVAPTARALLSVRDNAVDPPYRLYLADTVASQLLGTFGAGVCDGGAESEYSALADVLVVMVCDTNYRHRLVALHPRAPALQAPVTLLGGEYLLSTMVLSADGGRVVVVSFTGDPNDTSVPRDYEVLSIATSDGSVLGRWPVPDVRTITGLAGGGPANKVILNASIVVAGASRPQLISVDVATGTIEQTGPLTTRPQIEGYGVSRDGRLFVYDSNMQDVLLYDTLQPQVTQTLWDNDDLELLDAIGFVPETYDALVNRRTGRLPPPPFTPGPPGIPISAPTLWLVPTANPLARRQLIDVYDGYVARRKDGQSLVYSRTPGDPNVTELVEIAIADGTEIGVFTPAGGVSSPRSYAYFGASEDLLFVARDADSGEALYLARRDEHGTLHRIGSDRDYFSDVYFGFDDDGTSVGFSVVESSGSGAYRFFLCDMNAPGVSVPIAAPASDSEHVFVRAVFGPPDLGD